MGKDPMLRANRIDRMTEPAHYSGAVTPSDTVDLTLYSRGLFVGTGGDVALSLVGDDGNAASTVFKNVPSGQLLPFRVRRVWSTSTTASNIVAVWQMSQIGISLALTSVGGQFPLAETTTLIAAMNVKPSAAVSSGIDRLIRALKDANAWASFDTFYILALQDEQASRLNWINPGTNTITAVNSPTFTAFQGWQGDGATSYLNTNFASNGGGSPKFTANAAHGGIWSRTDGNASTNGAGSFGDNGSSDRFKFEIKNFGANTVYRPNSASIGTAIAPSSAIGHFVLDIAANAQTIYRNAVSYATDTLTTGSVTTTQYIGASSIGGTPVFSARQYAAYHAGGTLGATKTAAVYNAINTFLQSVGAA